MKRWLAVILIVSVLAIFFSVFFVKATFTGKTVEDIGASNSFGPSAEEKACMISCTSVGCDSDNMTCREANGEKCQAQCNVQKPEQTAEESCVETCTLQGCEKYDFDCQAGNQAKCDQECGMIKEPEAKSAEEQCIRDCVNKIDSNLICKPGEGGEKGDGICQQCAKECEHLYIGPCLDDLKLESKKKECQTCEHCYGEPVMGDSGEGYQCIVDIECKDASGEFGDNPGTGPGIIAKKISNSIKSAGEKVVDFFRGLFGAGNDDKTASESVESGENQVTAEQPSESEPIAADSTVSSGGGEAPAISESFA